jgi:hypothetical protein
MPWKQTAGGSMKGMIAKPPEKCDLCGRSLSLQKDYPIYDAAIRPQGPWAWMCDYCFVANGGKLGIGSGQQYKWVSDQECPTPTLDEVRDKEALFLLGAMILAK